MLRKITLILAATFAAGLLFVNVYTSIVDAPNWGREIPASIMSAREYFRAATPGTFFRIASPVNQLLTLFALIVCWRVGGRLRIYCAAALVCAVSVDLMTFAFFYPRNEIMFIAPLADLDTVRSAWSQWSNINWIRSGLVAVNLVLDYLALLLVAKTGT